MGRSPPTIRQQSGGPCVRRASQAQNIAKTVNLRYTTRDILSQVEQLTGFPVEVIEDRSLQTTAVVHMASRRTVPAHIVRTNPATGQPSINRAAGRFLNARRLRGHDACSRWASRLPCWAGAGWT